MDEALSSLVWPQRWPCLEQELGLGPPQVPPSFNPPVSLCTQAQSPCLFQKPLQISAVFPGVGAPLRTVTEWPLVLKPGVSSREGALKALFV